VIDRGRLLGLQGRSRKPQMALARRYGIDHYPSPAGGCLLTMPDFSRRLEDLFDHEKEVTVTDIELLKVGRHLRLDGARKRSWAATKGKTGSSYLWPIRRIVFSKWKRSQGPSS